MKCTIRPLGLGTGTDDGQDVVRTGAQYWERGYWQRFKLIKSKGLIEEWEGSGLSGERKMPCLQEALAGSDEG